MSRHLADLVCFLPTFLYLDFCLQGGSWITAGVEASRFARTAFRRHFFQHMGFRLARSVQNGKGVKLPVRMVDTDVFVLGSGLLGRHHWPSFARAKFCRNSICYIYLYMDSSNFMLASFHFPHRKGIWILHKHFFQCQWFSKKYSKKKSDLFNETLPNDNSNNCWVCDLLW